jgi:DNA-binding NarL/FixJ family response regulator
MSEPLTVLLVDDHPLFRKGMRTLLASMPEVELVGEARGGEEAVRLAESAQPDVVLMDLRMPDIGGLEATRRIVSTSPHIRVLVVTMLEDDDSVFAAMRAGARGYVLKDAEGDDIVRAIRAVGRGDAIFSPAVAQRVIDYFARPPSAPQLSFPELTDSERRVLRHMARGENNMEIARALSLSPKTVRNYCSNIFAKLQVADRAQAIVRAREAGLGRGEARSSGESP